MSEFTFIVTTALEGFLHLLAALASTVSLDFTGDLPKLNGMEMGLRFSNDNLDFLFGKGIRLADLFGNPTIETLGPPPDEVFAPIIGAMTLEVLGIFSTSTIGLLYKSRTLTLGKALIATIAMKTLSALGEILLVENELNSMQNGQTKGLIAEFLGELHFGRVLGFVVSLVLILFIELLPISRSAKIVSIATIEFLVDILKQTFFENFYGKIVGSEIPSDRYWLINEEGTGLRLGLLLGTIEASLFLVELNKDDASNIVFDFLTGGLQLIDLERIQFITNYVVDSDRTSLSIKTGLCIIIGVLVAAHLIQSAYWLERTDNYL